MYDMHVVLCIYGMYVRAVCMHIMICAVTYMYGCMHMWHACMHYCMGSGMYACTNIHTHAYNACMPLHTYIRCNRHNPHELTPYLYCKTVSSKHTGSSCNEPSTTGHSRSHCRPCRRSATSYKIPSQDRNSRAQNIPMLHMCEEFAPKSVLQKTTAKESRHTPL